MGIADKFSDKVEEIRSKAEALLDDPELKSNMRNVSDKIRTTLKSGPQGQPSEQPNRDDTRTAIADDTVRHGDRQTVSTGRPVTDAPVSTAASAPREPAGAAASGSGSISGPEQIADDRLIPEHRADQCTKRWVEVKGSFVDEPRQAVAQADQLVREVLNELHEAFGHQREKLERGLDTDRADTEGLRVALGHYRTFFDRLLTAGGAGDSGERLVPDDRVRDYTRRWDEVKVAFVDEPRQAVTQADQLVREVLNELHEVFGHQREHLQHGLDADQSSTEDLRQGLARYRSFFDRLLSI